MPSSTKKTTRKKSTRKKAAPKKRSYTQAAVVHDPGVKCPHCEECYGHKKHHKYPRTGRQRMICGGCGKPFIVWRTEK